MWAAAVDIADDVDVVDVDVVDDEHIVADRLGVGLAVASIAVEASTFVAAVGSTKHCIARESSVGIVRAAEGRRA